MNKITASVVTALLALGAVVAAPAAASATPVQCVPQEYVPAWTEDVPDIEHPAQGAPTIVIPNPDYVPANPGSPAVPAVGEPTIVVDNPDYVPAVEGQPAVYEIEYEYRHKILVWKTRWEAEGWNADGNPHSIGWYSTGNTRQGALITPEIPAQPAQGEPTITIPNPDYVPAVPEVPATPAVGEPTLTVPNPDHVPAWTEITPDIEHPEQPAIECDIPVEVGPFAPTFYAECNYGPVTWDVEANEPWLYDYVPGENGDRGYVQAYLPEGYVIAAGPQAGERYWDPVWELADYVDAEACPAQGPVDEPETPVIGDPEPAVDDEPTARVATADQPLAVTGADVTPWLWAGGSLLALGLTVVVGSRIFARRD